MSDRISNRGSLHRVIYVSRQTFAPEQSPEAEIEALLKVSMHNNGAVAVTGLLLVHAGWFVQVLEGRAEAVMTTYRRILGDKRHDRAKLIGAGPVDRREFGNWNMCARRLSSADEAIIDALQQRAAFDPHALTERSALRLLLAVRNIQTPALAAH